MPVPGRGRGCACPVTVWGTEVLFGRSQRC